MENKKNENISKNNKKRNIIIILVSLLLLIILLILWFFNRKFDVVFDYNNGTEDKTILVKYNKIIDSKNIKTKEDLGEDFINWYLVIEKKDGKDVLSKEPFDFKTKIKKDTNLKAVYDTSVKTITIKFDSKGGSNVDDITINKGSELNLPDGPSYDGYTFKGWAYENNDLVKNNTVFEEDTTLYALWEKVEEKKEVKKETPKKETPKQEEKKNESISISLTNSYINLYGTYKSSKASANVKNASGEVTYSISNNNCMKIDASTGEIKRTSNANSLKKCLERGATATVTATLPSGKSDSATITYEPVLVLTVDGKDYTARSSNKEFPNRTNKFVITANQEVKSWNASGVVKDESTSNSKKYNGKANVDVSRTTIKATTRAGQSVEIYCTPYAA